jgi:hypothetical protein
VFQKAALQRYSKCYRVASVTKTFTLATQQHLECNCKVVFETPVFKDSAATAQKALCIAIMNIAKILLFNACNRYTLQ